MRGDKKRARDPHLFSDEAQKRYRRRRSQNIGIGQPPSMHGQRRHVLPNGAVALPHVAAEQSHFVSRPGVFVRFIAVFSGVNRSS